MTATTLDSAFKQIRELVATFKANEARYLSGDYHEAEVRKDFIDKFFTALGWDVNHDIQSNPYAQEVKVERSHGPTQRRADYAFYLAPNFRDVRFYVEAKKPHSDIATADNYFQTIRYGSGSRTPLAVLTDFRELHVLDTRFKAEIKNALKRAVAKYQYTEYTDRETFAKIYWLFSREAVANGALEQFASTLPKKGKDIPPPHLQNIDDAFLDELEKYRDRLAHSFKAKNPHLDSEKLTEITQRTLDRLVFLRFLEDKQIEEHQLVARFGNEDSAWHDFIAASRRFDGIYNGVVFKENSILDAPSFHADNETFADICRHLSDEYSPYNFDAIPIHILGSIYERFLGKVIVATDQRVRVEDKPEVRKAGGVYYTPEYIVHYITENTVGKLIADKTPDQIAEMRFADIACGSGSFLLAVYDLLLAYHGIYYNSNPKKAHKGDCIERDGKLYLSLQKKREILLNNIYGVDIDAQAVEVCQLSLYLKLLKDETTASANQFVMDFEKQAMLPSLAKNIVCGNSLIGTDILEGQLFAGEEERKLNPMNFEDAFPEVMNRGGFDAIVGNPPYVQIENIQQTEKDYFVRTYGEEGKLGKRYDIYQVFVLRALSLLRTQARFGYILPNTFLMGHSYRILRKRMCEMTTIEQCVDLPQGVFHGVTVDNVLLFLRREPEARTRAVQEIQINKLVPKSDKTRVVSREWDENFNIDQKTLADANDYVLNVHANPRQSALCHKLELCAATLGEITESSQGIILYKTEADAQKSKYTGIECKVGWKKLLRGTNIGRYEIKWGGEYVHYGRWLWCPRDEKFFASPKILLQAMRNKSLARRLVGTFDNMQYYNAHNLANIITKDSSGYDLKYLLGCFNSTLLNFWYKAHFPNVNINPSDFRQLPIRRINFHNSDEKAKHDAVVTKVESMLEAKKQLAKAQTDKDKTYYENKCASLDSQIDRLVYDLYGLTAEEIAIVEKANTQGNPGKS